MNGPAKLGVVFCGALAFVLAAWNAGVRGENEAGRVVCNVVTFGARGDGVSKDTGAVQKAIDACAERGGGTVWFPAGVYLCGSLHLRSNVRLYLDGGAMIQGSKDEADYDPYEKLDFKNDADRETTYFHYALIWGEDVENVAITGTGTIDSNRTKRGGPKSIALKLSNVQLGYDETKRWRIEKKPGKRKRWINEVCGAVAESPDATGSALVCDDVSRLEIESLTTQTRTVTTKSGTGALLQFVNVRDALLRGCMAPRGTEIFLDVQGGGTRGICLIGNDVSGAKQPLRLGAAVDQNEVAALANRMR